MKPVKTISIISILFTIVLVILAATLQNPLETHYDQAIKNLMESHEYISEEEAIFHHPEFIQIEAHIKDIKQWQFYIQQASYDPIPPKEWESKALLEKMVNIRNTKNAIRLLASTRFDSAQQELSQPLSPVS